MQVMEFDRRRRRALADFELAQLFGQVGASFWQSWRDGHRAAGADV